MSWVLGHEGGWDELLIAAGIVLAFLLPSLWRARRRRGSTEDPRQPRP